MSEILVNTIKKADGTGGLTVPTTAGNIVTTGGATFTGAVTGTDLTLSGGVYLGGTGSANKLDDYEEGTWTATLTTTGTAFTTTSNTATCHYTKIGRMVTVTVDIAIASPSSGTGDLTLTGLPFTYTETSNLSFAVRSGRIDLLSDGNGMNAKLSQNNTQFSFSINRNAATDISVTAADLNGNATPFMNFVAVYYTTA